MKDKEYTNYIVFLYISFTNFFKIKSPNLKILNNFYLKHFFLSFIFFYSDISAVREIKYIV